MLGMKSNGMNLSSAIVGGSHDLKRRLRTHYHVGMHLGQESADAQPD